MERSTRNNAAIEITIPKEQGDPKRLVELAKRMKSEAERSAQREADDFLQFDEVWCVCDVDDHERLPDARQMARDNAIELVVSNPCFELWLILHFRSDPGPQDRHHVYRMLKRFLPGYDKHLAFERLTDGVPLAIERAARLHEQAENDGEPGRNPSTEVFRLARSILRTES